ncbi:MAG: tRNA (N6-isopentenyl adenosine(37)-C2)-methylthiotransferase MiaB [Geobacteraceae bacterium]|nr:tRNA (N6-isopentenyl adenosine(37)-C2)-methylthiotransferase MiaB [Geobacteraceae bacterium]
MQSAKKLYIETFGCQMNVNDSDTMVTLLRELDYEPVDNPSSADLIILNTCSIRAKAEQKVFSELGRMKRFKSRQKPVILGIGGCIAQQEGEKLLRRVPYLDLVFGTHSLHLLPDMVRAAEKGQRPVQNDFLDPEARLDLFPRKDVEGGVTRFVTVMQGCDNFCSYCIVPYVRGREVSRRSGEILREIREMADAGVKEVTLLGQNVNSYGLKSEDEPDFAALLRSVSAIDGIERIRFTTSHPKDMTPALISCFADLPKLCSHIHLPAQSGSDRVLERMNRGYDRNDYLVRIGALKAARPDILITGDMIVGFPGETEDDFQATLSLMEEVRYADLFSFAFSARPETEAARFPDDLTRREKQERLDRLQSLQRSMTMEMSRSLVCTAQEVLVEGTSKRGGQLFGRTSGNRIVNFAGDRSLVGSLVRVTIMEALPNSLLGEMA